MLGKLLNLFRRKPPEPSPLALAYANRRKAAEAYADARRRGDTRDQHKALSRFRRATTQLLAAEQEARAS